MIGVMATMITRELSFQATPSAGAVSALYTAPADSASLFVFAHGAGAGMRHPFIDAINSGLVRRGVSTFRYQFPYMEQGRRAPNPQKTLTDTVRSAVNSARELSPDAKLIAGGKSMGGRMTSLAESIEHLEGLHALAFLGFPLHAPGRDSTDRAAHLRDTALPMLFLQGTRDKLANLAMMKDVCNGLGARATLHLLDSGDHSFKPLKRSGRTQQQLIDEAAATLAEWIHGL